MTETVVHVTTFEDEIWKDIAGYEGLYQVSNLGRVKSLERVGYQGRIVKERILKFGKNGSGYYVVNLCKNANRKTFQIHRLVAKLFIDNKQEKPQINHKDENKTNNVVSNLEWVTAKENINYGSRTNRTSKSKSKRIKVIYQDDTYEFWDSATEFEKSFGIGRGCINNVLGGRAKSSYGMRFEYA